ncbi:MAG: SU10 major capsid protein [Candidatus Heimdallarchaeaceae archaeon]
MAQVSGQGTIWNLPNYSGELFTADLINTPILAMIGGMTNGGMQTNNFEFPTSSEYDFPAAAQPAITETASLSAPAATEAIRAQVKNATQIFQQAVKLSYVKLANAGRLSGINSQGAANNVSDELAWQIDYNLKIIARNIEYTIINGAYQAATDAGTAGKTRGLLEAIALSGGSAITASSATLDKPLMQELFRTMFGNGAMFMNPVIFANGFQKQKISDIYGFAPEDRNVGGINIKQIETDFGNIGIAPAHRFMPTDTISLIEMDVVKPVFQPVPGKGNFFYEDLSKTGASENGQIFGQFGLDHGPAFAHGKITGLAIS